MPFDLEQFKKAQMTGAMDDHFTPPPADVYKAKILDFSGSESQGKKDPTKTYTFMEITWELEDPTGKVKAATGLDSTRATQKLSLDMSPSGQILNGTGKNIGLGALRTALGQNDPKKPWGPSMLIGAKATIKVEIEKFTRRDGGDGQKAIVTSVAPYNAPVGGGAAASAMPSRPSAH